MRCSTSLGPRLNERDMLETLAKVFACLALGILCVEADLSASVHSGEGKGFGHLRRSSVHPEKDDAK